MGGCEYDDEETRLFCNRADKRASPSAATCIWRSMKGYERPNVKADRGAGCFVQIRVGDDEIRKMKRKKITFQQVLQRSSRRNERVRGNSSQLALDTRCQIFSQLLLFASPTKRQKVAEKVAFLIKSCSISN